MSALELYLKRAVETKGLIHLEAIRALRTYLKESTYQTLAPQIRKITSMEQLRCLWEAGLPRDIQDEVLRRYAELERRRTK